MWKRGLRALCVLAICCGCAQGLSPELRRELDDNQKKLRELKELMVSQGQRMEAMEEELSDGLSLALCRPELRQLLEDVQRECTAPTQGATAATASCTTKQIQPAVIAADPEHKGRFLKMMSFLRHEVVYIPQSRAVLTPQRKDRLKRLASQAMLRHTVFLVVSHPEAGTDEARRRAEYIEGLLFYYGIPRDKIRQWLYAFPTNRQDIERPTDRPGLGEPVELERGVWVFRADC